MNFMTEGCMIYCPKVYCIIFDNSLICIIDNFDEGLLVPYMKTTMKLAKRGFKHFLAVDRFCFAYGIIVKDISLSPYISIFITMHISIYRIGIAKYF